MSCNYNDTILTVLVFAPLVAAVVAALIKSESALRWWTFLSTTAIGLYSLPLFWRFDAKIGRAHV